MYQLFLFSYTLTILIISIVAYNNFKSLPIPFVDTINNWRQNPIYNIYKADSCELGDDSFFFLQNGQVSYTKWWHTSAFSLCMKRLKNYNFIQKYQLYPKCNTDEVICGGVYVQHKYCAPAGQCPYNSLLFVTSAQLASLDSTKYTNSIKIEEDFYLAMSSLAEALPISQLSIFGEQPCISSQYSNYETIFSQAYCKKDARFTLLNAISQSQYASANSFSSSLTSNIGIYSRSYTDMDIECRRRNLVNWANRTINDGDSLKVIQLMLVWVSAIYFGFIGFLYSLLYILQYHFDKYYTTQISDLMISFKIFLSYFHTIIILVAFGFWMDIKLYLQINISSTCSDDITLGIYQETLDDIYYEWSLNVAMFFVLIVFILVECSAFSVILDRFMKRKPTIEPIVYRQSLVYSQNSSQHQEMQLYQYFQPFYQYNNNEQQENIEINNQTNQFNNQSDVQNQTQQQQQQQQQQLGLIQQQQQFNQEPQKEPTYVSVEQLAVNQQHQQAQQISRIENIPYKQQGQSLSSDQNFSPEQKRGDSNEFVYEYYVSEDVQQKSEQYTQQQKQFESQHSQQKQTYPPYQIDYSQFKKASETIKKYEQQISGGEIIEEDSDQNRQYQVNK